MKKIVKIAFVAVVTAVAGLGVYTSQGEKIEMSDVALANVEALADNEKPVSYRKYFCNGSYNTNYYRCEIRSNGEPCPGPNPPYPC